MSEKVLKDPAKHKTIIWPMQCSVKRISMKYKAVNSHRLSQRGGKGNAFKKQNKTTETNKQKTPDNIPGNMRKCIHKDRLKFSSEFRSFPFTVLDDIIC